jgi:hypothetical protein
MAPRQLPSLHDSLYPSVSGAEFSADRRHRYALWRIWDLRRRPIVFVGLNPSTADERVLDPTVTRCVRYADAWGAGGLIMLNIFAYRSTDPSALRTVDDPIGPDNDASLVRYASLGSRVVAAWGAHGAFLDRGRTVAAMLPTLCALSVTKAGHPGHPLYLKSSLRPAPFRYAKILTTT